MRGKLVVISHTEHYLNPTGGVVGWGPTVRELNALAPYFKSINHIAFLHNANASNSSESYSSDNIKFIPLKPTGGKTLLAKLNILFSMFIILKVVRENLKDADFVQLRLPTGVGVLLLPYFRITKSKRNFTFWVKYAGNWNESKPPMGYAFQRWFLKKDYCKSAVTINGFWPDQPKHCISFENPCLSKEQIQIGNQILKLKKFTAPYNFVFIGRLEDEKGVRLILETFRKIDSHYINSLVIIGDGPKRLDYERIVSDQKYIKFLGGLSNKSIHEILITADFLLLPSIASEGFPKVIAEAACYGVIPIVSDVGSIAHYINEDNGFVCNTYNIKDSFELQLKSAIETESSKLQQKSMLVSEIAGLFTFDAYGEKLEKHIF
jgi:glycosyltransferase involved in cell wall biosynthesis